nr:putative serine/threonine-protein kinase isoform X2 [Ipomoea batatas]
MSGYETGEGINGERFRIFSYEELRSATQGFRSSCKIGEGGFGIVYKGRLRDGSFVAVKVLSVELGSLRGEREFISEISALSDIKHENLVRLRGCCVNGDHRLLVYDYMENNSLIHCFLGAEQSRMRFRWGQRKEIALGIARGLCYLHEELNPHIVHRDVKASNVLLDQNFVPKLSDFGLARLFRDNTSHISTGVAGTLGYLSPEYAVSGHLTRKSDVYSFGVLLLELINGGPIVTFDIERGEIFLVNKAWELHNAGRLTELVDPLLDGDFPAEEGGRLLKLGLLCVQETASLRPKMSAVMKMMISEDSMEGVEITRPGIVADLRDVKIGNKTSSQSFFSNRPSTSMSPSSPFRGGIRRTFS